MKQLILLGASEQGIIAAKKCGYEVIVIANRNEGITKIITEHSEIIFFSNIKDTSQTYKVAKEIFKGYSNIKLIISFTELGLETASFLSEKFHLPCNPEKVVKKTREKSLMRMAFQNNSNLQLDVSVYSGYVSELPKKIEAILPAIVKPNDGFGSKNISLINDQSTWLKWIRENRSSKEKWIVEPFIDGPEYSVETVTVKGSHYILGITQKETTGIDGFIEIGHSAPALIDEQQELQIINTVKESLDSLGVLYGPGHVEFKWDIKRQRTFIIELHTRPGGDNIPFLHYLSCGLNQYELGILSYEDKLIDIEKTSQIIRKYSQVRFFYQNGGLFKGIEIHNSPSEYIIDWDVFHKIGTMVPDTVDSYSRGGYVIACGDSKEHVTREITKFIEGVKFKIDQIEKM
jgi:biotin carboxylase